MSEALDKLKREMLERHRLWSIANPQEQEREAKKMSEGVRDMPVKQMLDQLVYIENELLPAIQKKKGREADYDFFQGVARSLAYAVILIDRYEYLQGRYVNSRIDAVLLKDHLQMAEKELEKYTTMEDLLMSDALNKYGNAVVDRVKRDILRTKL